MLNNLQSLQLNPQLVNVMPIQQYYQIELETHKEQPNDVSYEIAKIHHREEYDKQKFIKDVMDIIDAFKNNGLSDEAAASLAAAFYNEPSFQKKRIQRQKMIEKLRNNE